MLHSLIESDSAELTPAREETSPAEAVAWLEDPHSRPTAGVYSAVHGAPTRRAIGWRPARMQEPSTNSWNTTPKNQKGEWGPRRPRRWARAEV